MGTHELIVRQYAEATAQDPGACLDVRAACARYLRDLEDPRLEFRTDMAEFVILAIQNLFCHQQGEDLYGRPLRGKPLILQPFQLFIVYNICGFFFPGTVIRRYQEAFLMLARKNGKTPFATALIWAVGLWYSASYSKIKTVAGSMKQNMEGFGFLSYNLHRLGLTVHEDPVHGLRVLDSSLGHSFSGPVWDGQISFEALAYKPDIFDAFNANITDGWQSLVTWFNNLWDNLFKDRKVDVSVNPTSSGVDGSHANGLNYVPFDGYLARLHRGEMVLISAEAASYRSGQGKPTKLVSLTINTRTIDEATINMVVDIVNRKLGEDL